MMDDMPTWKCIYCKPKSCEIVKIYLERVGIEILYPIVKEKRTLNKKVFYNYKELFPNYIFAKFSVKNYRLVKYTRGVVKILSNSQGEPVIVPNCIIETIINRMDKGFIRLHKNFKNGDNIIITDGPFKEMEAIFLENIKPNERVLILLKTINSTIKMEIDCSLVDKEFNRIAM